MNPSLMAPARCRTVFLRTSHETYKYAGRVGLTRTVVVDDELYEIPDDLMVSDLLVVCGVKELFRPVGKNTWMILPSQSRLPAGVLTLRSSPPGRQNLGTQDSCRDRSE